MRKGKELKILMYFLGAKLYKIDQTRTCSLLGFLSDLLCRLLLSLSGLLLGGCLLGNLLGDLGFWCGGYIVKNKINNQRLNFLNRGLLFLVIR